MARRKKNKIGGSFVAILRDMLKSPAWEQIGNPARVAYLHVKSKCVTSNTGEIVTLSFNEMERIMERRTFAKAIRELEKFGFIQITQKGGLFRKRNYYMLCESWRTVKHQVARVLPEQGAELPPVAGNE